MPDNSISPQDRDLLIRTTIAEAGDQSPDGQAAVAHTIMNRVASGRWGNTPSQVVLARGQFAPWGQPGNVKEILGISPDSKQYQRVGAVVDGVTSGQTPDPTGGAKYFLDPSLQKQWIAQGKAKGFPDWSQGPGVSIGAHTFFNPDDPSYGAKSQAMGYMAVPEANPDPLGSWVKALPGNGSAPAPPAAPAAGDDPLAAWSRSLQSAPAPGAVPLPTARPADAGPSALATVAPAVDESLPAAVSRWTAEHQGNSWTDRGVRLGAGVLRGGGDVADTLAQGIASGVGGGANVLTAHGIISPSTNASVQDWRTGVNQGISGDQQAFATAAGDSALSGAGRLGGNVLASAPFIAAGGGALSAATRGAPIVGALAARPVLSAIAQGAGTGAAANVLTSSTSDQPLADQALSGAETGGVLGPLGYGAAKLGSKLIGGAVDRETAQLADAARNKFDIPVTAGQISANPTVRFMDSVLQRLPFSGYAARTAEQQTALNRAIGNEMGISADKITPTVINKTLKDLGNQYDSINARIGPLSLDQPFVGDLQTIRSNATYNLEPGKADLINGHIDNVLSKVDRGTLTIDPENYQYLTRKDGPLGKAIAGGDSGIREYAGDIKTALEKLVARNDPALAAEKNATDYKYFVASSLRPLAEESTTGDISPAKLLKAVDNSSTDVGEIGRIAKRFLKEPPSSGTAERTMIMQHLPQLATGAIGLGSVAGATAFDPDSWQRNALLAGGALTLGRLGSAGLRSNALANTMIRSGLRSGPGVAQKALNLAPPALVAGGALAQRRGALTAQSP